MPLILHCYTVSGHIYKLKLNYIHQSCNNYGKQTEPISLFLPLEGIHCPYKTSLLQFASSRVAAERHTVGLCSFLSHATLTHTCTCSPAFPPWELPRKPGLFCIKVYEHAFHLCAQNNLAEARRLIQQLKTRRWLKRRGAERGWGAAFGPWPGRRWGSVLWHLRF